MDKIGYSRLIDYHDKNTLTHFLEIEYYTEMKINEELGEIFFETFYFTANLTEPDIDLNDYYDSIYYFNGIYKEYTIECALLENDGSNGDYYCCASLKLIIYSLEFTDDSKQKEYEQQK